MGWVGLHMTGCCNDMSKRVVAAALATNLLSGKHDISVAYVRLSSTESVKSHTAT